MTVHRNGRNGRELIEPGRDEDVISPDHVATLIAAKVLAGFTAAFDRLRVEVRRDAGLAAKAIGDGFEQRLLSIRDHHEKKIEEKGDAERQKLCEVANVAIRRFNEMANDCGNLTKHLTARMELTVETAEKEARKQARELVAAVKQSSVETLTGIIGEEIERHKLEAMVRDAIYGAVRKAVRDALTHGQPEEPR